jgi:hypothetical protein
MTVEFTRDGDDCGSMQLEAEVKESGQGKVPYITIRDVVFVDSSGKEWRCSAFNLYQRDGKDRNKGRKVIGKLDL